MAASKEYTKAKQDRASQDVIEEKRAVFYQQQSLKAFQTKPDRMH
jgi:hypothetical protein